MLKRLYVDNYKCCTNFELRLGSLNLLLGGNGTGKTTVFEALRAIRLFAGLGGKSEHCFAASTLTKWQTVRQQTFEIEVAGADGDYLYRLIIAFDQNDLSTVQEESLRLNDAALIRFESGNVKLAAADAHSELSYPLEPSQSALALVPQSKAYEKIAWFRQFLNALIAVQINPGYGVMDSRSEREELFLNSNSSNFASWYRHISENQGMAIKISQQISEVLDGFEHFEFERLGETWRGLKVAFAAPTNGRRRIEYRFHELSDGQRALIVLYTLVIYASETGAILCIDEPENFLALPEIQPWLIYLFDLCNQQRQEQNGGQKQGSEKQLQAILISHHPELINYLAVSNGIWFSRENHGQVRTKRIANEVAGGLPISELVARGWIHG